MQPRMSLLAALLTSIVGGALLAVAFPAENVWWLAPIAVALMIMALRGRTIAGAFLVSTLGGLVFYLGLIDWISAFFGPMPLYALSMLQALWMGLGGILLMLAQRWWPARWQRGRTLALPWLLAALWLSRDLVASNWPYQGFAWGRLAQSQAEGPFLQLVSWIGLDGLTFLVAALGAAIAEVSWCLTSLRQRSHLRAALIWTAIAVLAALMPLYRLPVTGHITIAAVQGGSEKAGFFKGGTPEEIRQSNLDATAAVRAQMGERKLDLLVWPEGGATPDPLTASATREAIARLSEEFDAPVLVGAIHEENTTATYNTAQLWRDEQMQARYDKRRPVPFGEYVPDRHIWGRFAPQLSLITREYAPGTTAGVINSQGLRVGVGICFDVIDDVLAREHVKGGAQVIVYPTNNADFGRGDELAQQVTFARLRAVETGRAVVQDSTVGYTEAFTPDGRSVASLPWYARGAIVVDLPLVQGVTPASWMSGYARFVVSGLGVALLAAFRWWPRLGDAREESA